MKKAMAILVMGLVVALAAPASAALVGYWKAEGNPNDSSPYGNDGSWVGTPAYSADVPNKPYTLGGQSFNISSGNYVHRDTIGDLELQMNDTMTVALWVKDSSPGSWNRIWSHRDAAESKWNDLADSGNDADAIRPSVNTDVGGRQDLQGDRIENAIDGTWHFVTWTLDNGTAKNYVDGAWQKTYPYVHTGGFSKDGLLRIGADDGGGAGDVLLDEVSMWDTALDDAAILDLYNNGVSLGDGEVIPEPAGIGLIGVALLAVRRKRS